MGHNCNLYRHYCKNCQRMTQIRSKSKHSSMTKELVITHNYLNDMRYFVYLRHGASF